MSDPITKQDLAELRNGLKEDIQQENAPIQQMLDTHGTDIKQMKDDLYNRRDGALAKIRDICGKVNEASTLSRIAIGVVSGGGILTVVVIKLILK